MKFLFGFLPSMLRCSIIKLHDFIQFSFKRNHHGIMIGSKIFHLDLGWLWSSFFNHFLTIFFLNFHSSTFYFLESSFGFFVLFSFCGVIIFSFDLLRIDLQIFFYVSFYDIILILCHSHKVYELTWFNWGFYFYYYFSF
jgi:hypothetical protein